MGFHRHSLTAAAPSFHARVQHQISGGRAAATPSRNSTRAVTRAMFERFTEKAIKVVMLAQEEARRLGHNFVGTEQILLGLIGESTGIAAKVLKSMGVNLKEARVEVEKIIGRGSGFVAVEIPFTPRAKRVLELSLEEARQLGGWIAFILVNFETGRGPGWAVACIWCAGCALLSCPARGLCMMTTSALAQLIKGPLCCVARGVRRWHNTGVLNLIRLEICCCLFWRWYYSSISTHAPVLCCPSSPLHRPAGHNYIGTEHILLGLLRENEGVASRVLETLGADLQKIRTQVTALPAVLLLCMHVCHRALLLCWRSGSVGPCCVCMVACCLLTLRVAG